MTVYDVSNLISARPGFGLVKQHLEAMLCHRFHAQSESLVNTTSGSLTTLISVNATNVLTTDILIAVAQVTFSTADATRQGVFRLDLGGAAGQVMRQDTVTALTNGRGSSLFVYRQGTSLSGTVTAELFYARGPTSTTIYVENRSVTIFKFKSAV